MANKADDLNDRGRAAVGPASSNRPGKWAEKEDISKRRSPVTDDMKASATGPTARMPSSDKRQESSGLHAEADAKRHASAQEEQPRPKKRHRKGKRKRGGYTSRGADQSGLAGKKTQQAGDAAVSSVDGRGAPDTNKSEAEKSEKNGRSGSSYAKKSRSRSRNRQRQDNQRGDGRQEDGVKVRSDRPVRSERADRDNQGREHGVDRAGGQKVRGRDGQRPAQRSRDEHQGRREPQDRQERSDRQDRQDRRAKSPDRSDRNNERSTGWGNKSGSRSGNRSGNRPDRRSDQGRGARAPRSDRPVYAALDLGTNNCRLLVAEPHGQSFRVVDAFSRIVRLGEGLSQTGRLSNEAQERAISALKVCQSKLAYRRVKRFRLIATEACRRALNGGAFLHRVYKETGLKLEIVNRETEARLAVAGCASLVHPEAEGVVLFDIGGGSSEIVWLDLDPVAEEGLPQPGEKRNRQTRRAMRHLSERMRCWTSLQVGVVTLSEKHGGHVVTREHFEAMVAEVREMLHEFEEREALAHAIENKHIHMLGTSGTVTTLAGVHLGLVRYDRRQVDGTWLNADEVRSMINRVLEMDFEERIANPCIGQDRADLVLAGCAILEALHREWPCPRLRVADRGLREGILMEMMIDDGVWTPQQNKKRAGKNRRPRRRGGRGHRGHNTGQGSNHDGNQPSAPKEG